MLASQKHCIKLRKHTETFHPNKGYKLAVVVLIPTLSFWKQKFVVHFSNVICAKTRLCTPLLFIGKWITSTLSFIWIETYDSIFSPWGLLLPTGPFFRGSIFSQDQGLVPSLILDNANNWIEKYFQIWWFCVRTVSNVWFKRKIEFRKFSTLVIAGFLMNFLFCTNIGIFIESWIIVKDVGCNFVK